MITLKNAFTTHTGMEINAQVITYNKLSIDKLENKYTS